MSSPGSRQLLKSEAVGFLECHEADSIDLKNCPAYIRESILREQNRRPNKYWEERTWLGEM
jgi:hypothetical protein